VSSNTHIQILRSYANTAPSTLLDGEQAYSFVSNTLFVGDNAGHIIRVGGEYYTTIIELANSDSTPNTLVLRDENGAIDGGRF
jgi:hypothetical protein